MENIWITFIISILIIWNSKTINGYLNVFISHKEVIKIMGLEVDLFYVHEGAINTFAMQFRVPLPPDQYDVEFFWQSLIPYPLPYHLYVEYENEKEDVISVPQLSIPAKGYVPQTTETFTINLPCTGKVSFEVPFTIHLYVWGPPRTNDTKLNFKRTIICQKGHYPQRKHNSAPAQAPHPTSHNPELLGGAACAMGLVMVVGLIASAMYVRAKKRIRQDSLQTSLTSTADYGSQQNVFIRLNSIGRPSSVNSGSYATIASLNKNSLGESKQSWFRSLSVPSPYATSLLPMGEQLSDKIYTKPESLYNSKITYYASSQIAQLFSTSKSERNGLYDGKDKLRRLPNLRPGSLNCQKLIKEGKYSRLYYGKLSESCDVLIKTVIDGASLIQVAHLLTDASLLIGISHPNILAPMVANTELPGTPEIAYPNPIKGNLKIFLQTSRETNKPLSTRLLVQFGLQVTKGLSHLHSLGIIHKDIATRNCFLDSEFYVKICDNALSKDLFPNDYHCLGDNENLPIKWMALELLKNKNNNNNNLTIPTTTSDIWSLGVLFWELATLAAIPFVEVDPFELEPYLRDGYRLGHPINCPNEFYTLMSCCWLAAPNQRPSYSQLMAYLLDFHDDLKKYI